MRALAILADAERWRWFAAGDQSLARPLPRSSGHDNSPTHVVWLIGLTMAVPLALAVGVSELFG